MQVGKSSGDDEWSVKEVFVNDMLQICLILRCIFSGFPLCVEKFVLKQPLSMMYLQWDDLDESHSQGYYAYYQFTVWSKLINSQLYELAMMGTRSIFA